MSCHSLNASACSSLDQAQYCCVQAAEEARFLKEKAKDLFSEPAAKMTDKRRLKQVLLEGLHPVVGYEQGITPKSAAVVGLLSPCLKQGWCSLNPLISGEAHQCLKLSETAACPGKGHMLQQLSKLHESATACSMSE